MAGFFLTIVVAVAAAVTLLVLATAAWLRSGSSAAPTPPGYRRMPWPSALGAARIQIWPNLVTTLGFVPGLGQAALGRWRRAAAFFGAFVLVLAGIVAAAHLSGACSCTPGGAQARDTLLPIATIAVLVLLFGSSLDTMRIATRRATVESMSVSVGLLRHRETDLPSCPRCRAASREGRAFCHPCTTVLAEHAVALGSPEVAATELAPLGSPELEAYRGKKLVIGSVAGEAVVLGRSMQRVYGRRLRRLLRGRERTVEHAWRDPDDSSRLWTQEVQVWHGHEGERGELHSVCLHVWDDRRLCASWTASVLAYQWTGRSRTTMPVEQPVRV